MTVSKIKCAFYFSYLCLLKGSVFPGLAVRQELYFVLTADISLDIIFF